MFQHNALPSYALTCAHLVDVRALQGLVEKARGRDKGNVQTTSVDVDRDLRAHGYASWVVTCWFSRSTCVFPQLHGNTGGYPA